MSQATETRPGIVVDHDPRCGTGPAVTAANSTAGTVEPPFSVVRSLFSAKPLRRPNRSRPLTSVDDAEDAEDVADALAQLEDTSEPTIPWDDVKREFGLM